MNIPVALSICRKYSPRWRTSWLASSVTLQGSRAIGPAAWSLYRHQQYNDEVCRRHLSYLVIPAVSTMTCVDELSHIESWTTENNLKLNSVRSRTKEVIFLQSRSNQSASVAAARRRARRSIQDDCTALHGVINNRLTVTDHTSYSTSSWQHVPASSMLYVCFTVISSFSALTLLVGSHDL